MPGYLTPIGKVSADSMDTVDIPGLSMDATHLTPLPTTAVFDPALLPFITLLFPLSLLHLERKERVEEVTRLAAAQLNLTKPH